MTDSAETRKNKALACKKQLLEAMVVAKCHKDFVPLQGRWTWGEVSWVSENLFTNEQARKFQAILATEQLALDFSQ